jgi:hypothetical protein
MDHSMHDMPAAKPAPAKVPPAQDMPGMDHSAHDMPAAKPAAPPVRKPMQER